MNTAYLSNLFSTSFGMPFRSYLKGLRLEKAQQFLAIHCDRSRRLPMPWVTPTPTGSGLDFKDLTGLSPSAWRQALAARA